eukprot:COSAG04_NODE_319_length_16893_cov_23.060141_2_plen_152_part_00
MVKPDQDELRRAFDACDRADGELDGRIKVSSLHAVFVALGADPKRVTLEAVNKAVEEQADEDEFELRAVRQPKGPLEYELEYEIFENLMEGARARELFGDALKGQSNAATRVGSSPPPPPLRASHLWPCSPCCPFPDGLILGAPSRGRVLS